MLSGKTLILSVLFKGEKRDSNAVMKEPKVYFIISISEIPDSLFLRLKCSFSCHFEIISAGI